MPTTTTPTRTGYSYLRYSTAQQGDGDSVRRQTAAAEAWCKRHGVRLDVNKRMEDRGLSAADGTHIRAGALGEFLAEVSAGRIAEGSVLIVENLDRLSRETPWDAIPILCAIVNAGITVVTLSPSEMVYERGRDLTALVLAVVEFGRGHSESKTKSDRLRAAWGAKKAEARATHTVMTRQVPQWLELVGGELVPVPARVAVVRRIFDLAAAGHGAKMIARQLEAEGLKAWGYSGRWSKSYIHRILKLRSAVGEFQPHGITSSKARGRKASAADGDPIPGYYPAIVDARTWDRAQAAIAGRNDGGRPKGGRAGRVPDLFSGLLWDVAADCKMLTMDQTRGPKGRRKKTRVIAPTDGNDGRAPMITFPYRVFEAAILDRLREVSAAEVLGAEPAGESATLAGELALKEMRLKGIEAELTGEGDVPALVRAAKVLDHERQVILRKLAEARGRESNPKAEALAEMKTLVDVAAGDESTRLRLRSLLRTVIESVRVLVVPRRSVRLVAVQVNFAGGGSRSYFIDYRPAAHCRKEVWTVDDFTGARDLLDLRRKRDAADMRKFLERVHDGITAGTDRPGL